MGWLTRIKDSLLSKIRKKIPKKDLESVEKKREEKKILKEKKQIVKKEENEVKKENLVTKPEKKNFFGLFKKKQKVEKLPTVEKDPTEKKKLVSKIKNWFIQII